MKKNRLLAMILALVMLAANGALAQSTAGLEAAARAYVPQDATLTETEFDDGLQELTFYTAARAEKYEVKLDPSTGAVVKVSYDNKAAAGAAAATFTSEEAAQKVQSLYPGARIIAQRAEIDDGLHEIKLSFATDALYGEMELNAATGDVLEYELVIGAYESAAPMTEEAARAALLAQMPGVVITKIKLDEDDGRYEWEGDAQLDGRYYEFAIDALTGNLIEWELD